MSKTISRSELWDEFKAEADTTSNPRPEPRLALKSQPKSDIRNSLARAWLSGYIPLILLYLCFAQGYLVADAPIVALILLPLAGGRHGTTPTRLLLLSVVVMLAPPIFFYFFSPLDKWDPRNPMRKTYFDVTFQQAWVGLAVLAAVCLLTYFIRERLPWFESKQRPLWHAVPGIMIFFLPLVFFFGFLKAEPTPDVKQWEHRVLETDPYLKNRRLLHRGRRGAWERILGETDLWGSERPLSSIDRQFIPKWEQRALQILKADATGPARDGRSTDAAQIVLDGLARRQRNLENPLQIIAAAEVLRMESGLPSIHQGSLEEHCRAVLSSSVDVQTLKKDLALLEGLIAKCPNASRQYERYLFLQRREVITDNTSSPVSFINLRQTKRSSSRVHNINSWLTVLPLLRDGATLRELEVHPDGDVSHAARRMTTRDADLMHEHTVKPLWELYAMLYRLKIHEAEAGALPVEWTLP